MMNMEEQFQRFVDSQSGGLGGFRAGASAAGPRIPAPLPFRSFEPQPITTPIGLSISQQVYKYVKWITIVIVVGLIIYFLHSYTKRYLFPKIPSPDVCEKPLHPSGQPPLPATVNLANEYENNQFVEEEEEEEEIDTQKQQQEEEEQEEKDDKFTPLSELADA